MGKYVNVINSDGEFQEFNHPDGRRKRWFTLEGVADIAE